MYPAQGICNFGELSRVAEIFHSFSVPVKASVVYAAAAFVLSTESDNLSLTAEALPPPSFVCCCCCVVASSALSLELCLVPEVEGQEQELCLVPELKEQECVHLPDRGGRRCLELHGDSGKVWWGRILAMEERDVNERVVEVVDQERGHNEEEVMIIMVNVA